MKVRGLKKNRYHQWIRDRKKRLAAAIEERRRSDSAKDSRKK